MSGSNGNLPRPLLRNFSTIEPQAVSWLWPGVIPLGTLTVWVGMPEVGKSTLTGDIAARLTRGLPMPGVDQYDHDEMTNGNGCHPVIFCSAEDDVATTIKPRLMAAGADTKLVESLEGVIQPSGDVDELSLLDLRVIAQAVEDTKAKLVIIDPVNNYMGGVETYKNSDVRQVLGPLRRMAEHLEIAVLLVSHPIKSGGSAMHAVSGSAAFVEQPRSVYYIGRMPDDPDRRGMARIKCNLWPESVGYSYTMRGVQINLDPEDEDQVIDAPVIDWDSEPMTVSADKLIAHAREGGAKAERSEVEQWLEDQLEDGPVWKSDLVASGTLLAYSWRQIERSKVKLGVKHGRVGFGPDMRTYWYRGEDTGQPTS